MMVVLDTNVLVQMFGRASALNQLKQALLEGRIRMAVSTPILLEYEEVICRCAGRDQWPMVLRILEVMRNLHRNVHQVSPTYRFKTITGNPDDDAFADCAIVAPADFIITSDRHFDALAGQGYQPEVIRPEEFIRRFLS